MWGLFSRRLAQALGLSAVEGNSYQQAVPFVSLEAAALGVGRVLAAEAGAPQLPKPPSVRRPFRPQAAELDDMTPVPDCYCQTRRRTIARIRAQRKRSPTS